MFNIAALDKLIHELTRLPGVGEKTAQRLAFFILKEGHEYSENLTTALSGLRESVHPCPQCFSYTDLEICRICANPDRDPSTIYVVEQPSDVVRLEACGAVRGRYHVLQGSIAPLDGVGPEDLTISQLVEHIEKHPEVKEVVLALDADLEGDTTALYLHRLLAEKNIKVTRIAHGVPFGGNIDYIDNRTLGRALENRVEL